MLLNHWLTVLGKTFRRGPKQSALGRKRHGRFQSHSAEVLEDRTLLTVIAAMNSASGEVEIIEDSFDRGDLDDTVTLTIVGDNLHVFDPNGVTADFGFTEIDANNAEIPLASITGQHISIRTFGGDDVVTIPGTLANFNITFEGGSDSDELIVDLTLGNPVATAGVTFHGGDGGQVENDVLTIEGGTANLVNHQFLNASDGNVDIDGFVIAYTGLEPIVDNVDAVDRGFEFLAGMETISLFDSGTAGVSVITSSAGESVEFLNPSNSMRIETATLAAMPGLNDISISDVGANFDADLNIIAGVADTVSFTGTLDLGSGNLVTFARDILISDSITTTGDVLLVARGDVANSVPGTIDVFGGIDAGPGTVRLVGHGDITQYSGSIIRARQLGIRNNSTTEGDISLPEDNEVDSFAAANAFAGGTIDFHDADDLEIGTVSTITVGPAVFEVSNGIKTNGGDVDVSAVDNLTSIVAGEINTTASVAGDSSGNVTLDATVLIDLLGDIVTVGAGMAPGPEGIGGDVVITAGDVGVAGIDTSGRYPGLIVIDANDGSPTIRLGGDIAAVGAQEPGEGPSGEIGFDAPVLLSNNVTVSGTDVSFRSTVDSEPGELWSLTANASNDAGGEGGEMIWFADDIGATDRLSALTTNAGRLTTIDGSVLRLNGNSATFNNPVILMSDLTIDEIGGGDVRFNSTVDRAASLSPGQGDLILNVSGGGGTFFDGDVGAGSVSGTVAGLGSAFGASIIVQNGDVTFGVSNPVTVQLRNTLRVTGNGVTIAGETDTRDSVVMIDPNFAATVVTVVASDVTITDLTVTGALGLMTDGIFADGVANVTLDNVRSHTNRRDGFRGTNLTGTTTIIDSEFRNNRGDGIHLENIGVLTVTRTSAIENFGDGVYGSLIAGVVTVTDGTYSANGQAGTGFGLALEDTAANVTIDGGTFNGNFNAAGIAVSGDSVGTLTVTGVTANENGEDGLRALLFDTVNVNGNSAFTSNRESGAVVELVGTTNLTDVTATDNRVIGIFLIDIGEFHAEGVNASQNFLYGLYAEQISGPFTVTGGSYDQNGQAGLGVGLYVIGEFTSGTVAGGTYSGNLNGPGIAIGGSDLTVPFTSTLTLTGVTADNNQHDGLLTAFLASLTVNGNSQFNGNTLHGIEAYDTISANFTDVTASGNWIHGLELSGIETLNLTRVTAQDNFVNGVNANLIFGQTTVVNGTFSTNGQSGAGDGFRLTDFANASFNGSHFNSNFGGNGLRLEGDGSNVAIVQSVTANDNRQTAAFAEGHGLSADMLSSLTVNVGANFSSNRGDGMHISDVTTVAATNVTAMSNLSDGLDATTVASLTLTGGTLNDNRDIGVRLDQVTNTSLGGTIASANFSHGAMVTNATGTVNVSNGGFSNNGQAGAGHGFSLAGTFTTATFNGGTYNANFDGNGIDVTGDGNNTVNMMGPIANGNRRNGILASTLGTLTVMGGDHSDNFADGLNVASTSTVAIDGGYFARNRSDGIDATTICGFTTSNAATFSGNAFDGVKFTSVGTSMAGGISDATISANGRYGVHYITTEQTGVSSSTVTGNANDGIFVASGTGNAFSQNAIYGNGAPAQPALGIDLAGGTELSNGVTLNDKDFVTPENTDDDTGANQLQNTPEILYAYVDQGQELVIVYHVPSDTTHANYGMTVEFFLSDFVDDELGTLTALAGTDGRQGAVYVATDTYDATEALTPKTARISLSTIGNPEVQSLLASPAVVGFETLVRLVATATDADGNTSEFSRAGVINPAPGIEGPDTGHGELPQRFVIDQLATTGFFFTPGPVNPLPQENPSWTADWDTTGDRLPMGVLPTFYNNEFGIYTVDDATGRVGSSVPGFGDGYAQAALNDPTGPTRIIRQKFRTTLVSPLPIVATGAAGVIRFADASGFPSANDGAGQPTVAFQPFDVRINGEQIRIVSATGNPNEFNVIRGIKSRDPLHEIGGPVQVHPAGSLVEAVVGQESFDFSPEERVAFYLIRNSSSLNLLGQAADPVNPVIASNPLNAAPEGELPLNLFQDLALAFFSFNTANPDFVDGEGPKDHIRSELIRADDLDTDSPDDGDFTGQLRIYWEDSFAPMNSGLGSSDFDQGFRDGEDAYITFSDPFVRPVLLQHDPVAGPTLQSPKTTVIATPTVTSPTATSPTGTTVSTTPTFAWTAVVDAARYDLWVNDLTTGQSGVIRDQQVSGTSYTPTTALTNGHDYIWTVRAIDSDGTAGEWATHHVFTVNTLTAPEGLTFTAASGSTAPQFSWNAVAGAHHYDIWVNDLTTGQSGVIRDQNVTGTTAAGLGLQSGHSYIWTVRAVDANGVQGEWGIHQTFTLAQLDAQAIETIEPTEDAQDVSSLSPSNVLTDAVMAGWSETDWWAA